LIIVYKIMNLKTGYMCKENYFYREDAQRALKRYTNQYIHEVAELECRKLVTQSVNVEALHDVRKNDRMTVHKPYMEQGVLMGFIHHRREMKPVVYDRKAALWRAVAQEEAVAC